MSNSSIEMLKPLAQKHDRFTFQKIMKNTILQKNEILELLEMLEKQELITKQIIIQCIECNADLIPYKTEYNYKELPPCIHCGEISVVDPEINMFKLIINITEKGKEFFRG